MIHGPDEVMRIGQYKILTGILDHVPIPDYIYAFEKNKSIPEMAKVHINKNMVISLDIKDFFHAIKQKDLLGLFLDLGFGPKPALTLAEVCTYKAYVPQGALTSPKISNIIAARTFGPQIKSYCDSQGFSLSIYADDITVSMDVWKKPIIDIIQDITKIITQFGFKVNYKKTKIMSYVKRQWVCGVVVNAKTNLQVKERQLLRAIVNDAATKGIESASERFGAETPNQFISKVHGKLNWFKQLNPEKAQKYIDQFKAAVDAWRENQEKRSKLVKELCEDPSILASESSSIPF